MIEHVLELTRQTAKILADDPQFELLAEPQLSTVLFRFRPSDPALADDLNRSLHEELLSSGRAIIGRTSIGGKIALKLTLLNPCLVENDLIELVELLRTAGSRLDRGAL